MADFDRTRAGAIRTGQPRVGTTAAGYDEGLRAFMLGVYNNMALGLAITGLAAMATLYMAVQGGQLTAFGEAIYLSPLRWVVMLAPLAFVFGLSFGIERMQPSTARGVFFLYAAVMGLSLSSIFLVFTGESIARTFFVTAAAFGALSLYGYTTKKDLTAMGKFLFMGLIGLIIAMVVNIFLGSSGLQFAISAIGVLIFSGLIAYDTQRLKHMYDYVAGDEVAAGRTSILGALSLYLNFINLFMFLLQFMGNRE